LPIVVVVLVLDCRKFVDDEEDEDEHEYEAHDDSHTHSRLLATHLISAQLL
jgi:hypothetical protein